MSLQQYLTALCQAADACCPVRDCNTPVQPQDYQVNRTLLQVASCADNIKSLLHLLQESKVSHPNVGSKFDWTRKIPDTATGKDDETVGNIEGLQKLASSREQFPLPKVSISSTTNWHTCSETFVDWISYTWYFMLFQV